MITSARNDVLLCGSVVFLADAKCDACAVVDGDMKNKIDLLASYRQVFYYYNISGS